MWTHLFVGAFVNAVSKYAAVHAFNEHWLVAVRALHTQIRSSHITLKLRVCLSTKTASSGQIELVKFYGPNQQSQQAHCDHCQTRQYSVQSVLRNYSV